MKKLLLIGCGMALGMSALTSFASVPRVGHVTDDTAIYQNLSEIRVAREREVSFDQDIARLSMAEGRYRENMPLKDHPRLKGVVSRVSATANPYRSQ